MKNPALALVALGVLISITPLANGQSAPPPPATDTTAPDIPGVVAGGTKVTLIREGFQGTEGPISLPDGSLIFTETNASRITKIDPQDRITTFLEDSNGSNGLAFDARGRLISVQTVPGMTRVGVIFPGWAVATLQDGIDGRPNDLVVTREGGIYYTVPGLTSPVPGAPPRTTPFEPAVYYIAPGRAAIKVADGIANPNGVQLSRDERTLYVNDTRGPNLLAFDRRGDGTLTRRRNFAAYEGVTKEEDGVRSGADGLAIDSEGRVYAATTIGVQAFSPSGQHLGTIPVSRRPQNLAFAGPDKKTLYIVGSGAAWKVQMLAQGFRGRAK